jgi:electron transfer flavoprotein alpha subunit
LPRNWPSCWAGRWPAPGRRSTWVTRLVGISGMQVKPRLYLALGISGAPEHVEGMKSSALIIAVNTDPGAPIFDVAHYGAAEDLLEVVPALIEQIKERKGA